MHISLIWAMSRNRVIGKDNTLPWRLRTDLQHFMSTTMGKPVIMGRNTFESMKSALPGRTNIVITSNADYDRKGIKVATNLADALNIARAQCVADKEDEMFIAGGARVYQMGLQIATRLYVTEVDAEIEGDTFFPEIEWQRWQEMGSETFPANKSNEYGFTIRILERAKPTAVTT